MCKIAGCSATWVCRGHNPEKERVQILDTRTRYRHVANDRCVPMLVKQEHGYAVHHFLLLK